MYHCSINLYDRKNNSKSVMQKQGSHSILWEAELLQEQSCLWSGGLLYPRSTPWGAECDMMEPTQQKIKFKKTLKLFTAFWCQSLKESLFFMHIFNLSSLASLWYFWQISLTFNILHLFFLIRSNNRIDKIESNSTIFCAEKAATQKDKKKKRQIEVSGCLYTLLHRISKIHSDLDGSVGG